MASISLEQAWQNKKATGQNVTAAQDKVNTLTQELGDASSGLDHARQDDQTAESTLEAVASRTPPNTVAETSDGTILFSIGGHIYEYQKVPAGEVSGDDGNPDPQPQVPPHDVPPPGPDAAPPAGPTGPADVPPVPDPSDQPTPGGGPASSPSEHIPGLANS